MATDRIAQLEDNLTSLYRLLGVAEKAAIDAIDKIAQEKYTVEAENYKSQIQTVEQEYAQRLAQQVKRHDLPDSIAEPIVAELVDEFEMMQSIAKNDEMRSMLQDILAELQKPGVPAAAKLKVAIPLVPGFVAIELEGDAESVVRRLFPTFVRAYEGVKAIAGK